MEAFSLLKYWRGGGGVAVRGGLSGAHPRATTIVTAVPRNNTETDDDDDDDDDEGDDGPFFDLEFSLTDEEVEQKNSEAESENDSFSDEENDDAAESSDADEEHKREFNFTLTSGSNSNNNDHIDPKDVAVSPCDDENLLFKGRLIPVESNSVDSFKPQFAMTSSLLKSATKIRVFLSGFKKSKANTLATDETSNDKPNENANMVEEPSKTTSSVNKQSRFFTVKFNVEEVPLVSMFTRDNSKNIKTTASPQKLCDKNEESCVVLSDEKQRLSKDVMQKYLKKVKPLYVRVSKRYGEKLRFSGQLSFKTADEKGPMAVAEVAEATVVGGAGAKSVKQEDSLPAGLRVVYKHLGKSRSASSAAVAAAPSPPETMASRRRDDSLLQQQDGIQGAILHCKRSFNASRDSDWSLFPRSVHDPSHEKSNDLSLRKSSDTEPQKAGKS